MFRTWLAKCKPAFLFNRFKTATRCVSSKNIRECGGSFAKKEQFEEDLYIAKQTNESLRKFRKNLKLNSSKVDKAIKEIVETQKQCKYCKKE